MLLFTAQDLVLFYVGWEVMIIPLYILMGVWGGTGRRAATLQFVIFTLIGSLAMLVAIATLGVEGHSFELSTLSAQGRDSVWLFLAFSAGLLHQGADVPAARLAARGLPRVDAGGDRHCCPASSPRPAPTACCGSPCRCSRPPPTTGAGCSSAWAWPGCSTARWSRSASPTARGVVSFSSLGQMNLIIIGIFALNSDGRTGAIFQMVNHGVVSLAAFLLVGLVELRCGTDSFAALGGLANRRPIASTVFLMAALWTLAVPGSSAFVSELYILIGAFRQNAWLGSVAAIAIVLAAMYMLRWTGGASPTRRTARQVAKDTPDLRIGELGIAVPLLLILLVHDRVAVRHHGADRMTRSRRSRSRTPPRRRSPSRSLPSRPELVLLICALVLICRRDLPARQRPRGCSRRWSRRAPWSPARSWRRRAVQPLAALLVRPHDPGRRLRRRRAADHLRGRPAGGARLVGRRPGGRRPRGRVLRAAADRHGRHGAADGGQQLRDRVRRAGAVLARAVHPGGDRARRAARRWRRASST